MMSLDFWAEYYSHRPNDGTEEFETDDFEADVAAMLAEDDDWEEIPAATPEVTPNG